MKRIQPLPLIIGTIFLLIVACIPIIVVLSLSNNLKNTINAKKIASSSKYVSQTTKNSFTNTTKSDKTNSTNKTFSALNFLRTANLTYGEDVLPDNNSFLTIQQSVTIPDSYVLTVNIGVNSSTNNVNFLEISQLPEPYLYELTHFSEEETTNLSTKITSSGRTPNTNNYCFTLVSDNPKINSGVYINDTSIPIPNATDCTNTGLPAIRQVDEMGDTMLIPETVWASSHPQIIQIAQEAEQLAQQKEQESYDYDY